MSIRLASVALLALLLPAPAPAQSPRFVLELEGGAAWLGYNDVEIPNDGSATRWSLRDVVGSGPWPTARLYATWNLNERHGLRVLLAPFSLSERGIPEAPLEFAGASYAAGVPVEAQYTFDSYRLTYRYRLRHSERATAWIGATAKVRDATVSLEQGGTASREENVGIVPLLHLAGEWRVEPRWRVNVDADALAGGPGRAIDAAVKVGRDVGGRWTVQAGYRTLEGGADVEEAYNFAWLHYAVGSVTWRW